ncbi:unnamed protein product [Ascophyllum nodosum]
MDDEQARRRLLEGGYFVAMGVPPGIEFGIDLKSYQTGPRFRGVKMIPAGLHLAHYGTGEGEKQASFKIQNCCTGFFFRSAAQSVAAAQWDARAEDLVNAEACLPEGALRGLRDSVLRLEMDASLGPYPFDQRASWVNLTNYLSEAVLVRCGIPLGTKVLAGSSAADTDSGREGGRGVESSTEVVPHFPHVGRVARYSEVPGRGDAVPLENGGRGPQMDPQELTKKNMDRSEALRELVSGNFGGKWVELLGEAQLSFVLFISLSSLQGFRHWQAVCALLCQCGDALAADPALFVAFIRVLHAQLELVPEDFFDAEISRGNFLVPSLSALLQNIFPDDSLSPALADAAKRLVKFLQRRFDLFAFPNTSTGTSTDHPRQSLGDDGATVWGDEGSSDDDNEAGVPETEAFAVQGELRLELSEEDRPAVVPYEEVARVLGAEALIEGVPQQSGVHQPGAEDRVTLGETSSNAGGAPSGDKIIAKPEAVTSAPFHPSPGPSAQHARRWQDIDRLLLQSATTSSRRLSDDANPGGLAAVALATGGRAAAAAKRYPTAAAAARAVEQAAGFLEEIGESEDQGALFLELSSAGKSRALLGERGAR